MYFSLSFIARSLYFFSLSSWFFNLSRRRLYFLYVFLSIIIFVGLTSSQPICNNNLFRALIKGRQDWLPATLLQMPLNFIVSVSPNVRCQVAKENRGKWKTQKTTWHLIIKMAYHHLVAVMMVHYLFLIHTHY